MIKKCVVCGAKMDKEERTMRFYDGIHIVKHEEIGNVKVEYYIAFESGKVKLKRYENNTLVAEKCVADVSEKE